MTPMGRSVLLVDPCAPRAASPIRESTVLDRLIRQMARYDPCNEAGALDQDAPDKGQQNGDLNRDPLGGFGP